MSVLSVIKKKNFALSLLAIASSPVFAESSSSSSGAAVYLSSLLSKIDVSTVAAAILTIGVSGVTLYLTLSGVRIVWRMIKGV